MRRTRRVPRLRPPAHPQRGTGAGAGAVRRRLGRRLLPRYERSGRYRFHEHGFDLFSFPSNARLMWFDVWRFVQRMVERYRGGNRRGIQLERAVRRAGRSTGRRASSACRAPIRRRCCARNTSTRRASACANLRPICVPQFELVPYTITREAARALRYPLFVKPVKATFSVLARRCDTPEQLIEHLRFRPWEKHIIKRLIEPHNQALKRFPRFSVGSDNLLVEEVLEGRQINVDGFVHGGQRAPVGHHRRNHVPGHRCRSCASLSPASPTRRWRRGCATPPSVWCAATHWTWLLQPRVFRRRAQRRAQADRSQSAAGGAAGAVLRLGARHRHLRARLRDGARAAAALCARAALRRSGQLRLAQLRRRLRARALPTREDLAWLAREYPEARLELYPKRGASLRRDIKWLGSHRWAVLNMPGRDAADLRRRYERICERLRWPAPY